MIVLFFDTETTGLPKNWKAPVTDVDNWPRVFQLAWAVWEDGVEMETHVDLITPEGWLVPREKFWLDHEHSTENCVEYGIPIADALSKLMDAIEVADVMVAHNLSFDHKVVGAEMVRLNISTTNKPKKICTMNSSTKFCALPGPYGLKWPKLEELHHKLFASDAGEQHDAGKDIAITAKCFFELVRIGVIEL